MASPVPLPGHRLRVAIVHEHGEPPTFRRFAGNTAVEKSPWDFVRRAEGAIGLELPDQRSDSWKNVELANDGPLSAA